MVEQCGILCKTALKFILWMAVFRDKDLDEIVIATRIFLPLLNNLYLKRTNYWGDRIFLTTPSHLFLAIQTGRSEEPQGRGSFEIMSCFQIKFLF